MKKTICILAILWSAMSSFSQSEAVSVGKRIDKKISIISQEKPVILYFFATWCQPCIAKMPGLDSLVKSTKGNLDILVITYESKDKIDALRKKNKAFAGIALPVITSDTILSRMFPYNMVPQVVWIYKGIVQGITSADEINNAHVTKFISGELPSLTIKKDLIQFDRSRSLLEDGNGGTASDLVFQTALTRFLPGIPSGGGLHYNEDSTVKRIYFLNNSLPDLFAAAAQIPRYSDKILIHAKDISKYKRSKDQLFSYWAPTGCFCFEITVPATTPDATWRRMMMETLNILSPLHATLHGDQLIISEKN